MKATISVLLLLLFVATAVPQTLSLGQGVFYSGEGAILIAVDAAVAIRKIKSPYVMFRAYMVAAGGESIVVDRADVVMIYGDVEYRMPAYKEFQKAYSARQGDLGPLPEPGKGIPGPLAHEELPVPRGVGFLPRFRAEDGPDERGVDGRQHRVQDDALFQESRLQEGRYDRHPGQ